MSVFSKQKVYCRACGVEMFADLAGPCNSITCSSDCRDELQWRETLSMMGKEYYPRPGKEPEPWCPHCKVAHSPDCDVHHHLMADGHCSCYEKKP